MPLILVNAIGLSANTYTLQEVDASLYQVFNIVFHQRFAESLNSFQGGPLTYAPIYRHSLDRISWEI
jgi:hypothetical protein